MKLSIIVCVYNTKNEYLDASLKSIRQSSLSRDDYELIVIDDGSSQKYDEIIEKYNPVYVKTENRGPFCARLYGVMIAKGEYVAFCDADDTVSFNYYAPMLKKAYTENADIVINDWAFDTDNTKYACGDDRTIKEDLHFEGEEILRFFASGEGRAHSYYVQWNKLYKRSTLLKAKLELEKTDAFSNRRFSYSEDALFNFFVMKNAKKLVNTHTGYYFYRLHDAQTVLTKGTEGLKKEVEQMSLTFDIMLENLPENSYKTEIKGGIESWRAYMARKHYSFAKNQRLDASAFEYIKEKYKQETLQQSKVKDSIAYVGNILLGENFNDIDRELYRIYKAEGKVNVIYNKKDKYVNKTIEYLTQNAGVIISKDSNKLVVIPKRKISARSKLLHNRLAYLVGISLFKKGSKMRSILKGKL